MIPSRTSREAEASARGTARADAPDDDDLLTIRDLGVEFDAMGGHVRALDGLSLRVRAGSTVALVGESGSGKSVTAGAVLGLLPKNARLTSGEILFRDPQRGVIDLARLPRRSREFAAVRGDTIAMVFQEPMTAFSPLHTIGDQIGEALIVHRDMSARARRAEVLEMLRLAQFADPRRAIDAYPFELSGGQRQRAMIAMALICRPALLIADEPTTALDVTVQAQVLQLIAELQAELGMAVLLITHDLGVVANLAEEVIVVHRGRVMEAGTVRDVLRDARHPYLQALLSAVPTLAAPEAQPRVEPAEAPLVKPTGDPLLRVDGLTVRFRMRRTGNWFSRAPRSELVALDDVSFSLRDGECLGLVGESGSGKTTVGRSIMGAVRSQEGSILLRDEAGPVDLATLDRSGMRRYRRRIQYVFQDPYSSLDPRMTVADILAEPLVIQGIGDARSRRDEAERLARLVGLRSEHLHRYPHSFSGGQRQRIGIARALALHPDILICDEPTSALDVSVQAQVLTLLQDLQRKAGLTFLFISHNLAVVARMADRVAVMRAGEILEIAPCERLFADPVHPYTRALVAAVPTLDLDSPLDFGAIGAAARGGTRIWGSHFAREGAESAPMLDLGGGHLVRAFERPPAMAAVA